MKLFLRNKIEINKGFFYALYDADASKYNELFGTYDDSLDAYFYCLYGYRTASNLVMQNSLTNIGHILWIRFYDKWKKLTDELNLNISNDFTYKHDTTEIYKGTGTSKSTNNDLTKKYGFDSDEGKNDTSNDTTNDSNSTTDYNKTYTQTDTSTREQIDNVNKAVSLINDRELLNMIVIDVLKLVANPLYNDDED